MLAMASELNESCGGRQLARSHAYQGMELLSNKPMWTAASVPIATSKL